MERTVNPRLEIDLNVIEENTKYIVEKAKSRNAEIWGVTKGLGALPEVAFAMLRGGVAGIADSRLQNLKRLRSAGLSCPLLMLRIPMPGEVSELIRLADVSLNSEVSTIRLISAAVSSTGPGRSHHTHGIFLMVDIGDLREGIWPEDLATIASAVRELKGIAVQGIATNLGCFGGVLPCHENMSLLCELAEIVEREADIPVTHISAGGTVTLPLLFEGRLPSRLDHFRIGEGILLGTAPSKRGSVPLPGARQDGVTVYAEVVEIKEKPSIPLGDRGPDAFGRIPEFLDKGTRKRAVLAIGRQDVEPEGLRPLLPGAEILGASSDHMILDVSDCDERVAVGDVIAFRPSYAAMLRAATSEYVTKVVHPAT
ncbi:MAG TPA: alanine/ornithine racemase family PLP-dependent enzyme [Clostridia bacterium]|nr:alanine/ornithine racemase family PLP-dependent enzyme [Clostridia bacterium]